MKQFGKIAIVLAGVLLLATALCACAGEATEIRRDPCSASGSEITDGRLSVSETVTQKKPETEVPSPPDTKAGDTETAKAAETTAKAGNNIGILPLD